jgi:hypothetical protein
MNDWLFRTFSNAAKSDNDFHFAFRRLRECVQDVTVAVQMA